MRMFVSMIVACATLLISVSVTSAAVMKFTISGVAPYAEAYYQPTVFPPALPAGTGPNPTTKLWGSSSVPFTIQGTFDTGNVQTNNLGSAKIRFAELVNPTLSIGQIADAVLLDDFDAFIWTNMSSSQADDKIGLRMRTNNPQVSPVVIFPAYLMGPASVYTAYDLIDPFGPVSAPTPVPNTVPQVSTFGIVESGRGGMNSWGAGFHLMPISGNRFISIYQDSTATILDYTIETPITASLTVVPEPGFLVSGVIGLFMLRRCNRSD